MTLRVTVLALGCSASLLCAALLAAGCAEPPAPASPSPASAPTPAAEPSAPAPTAEPGVPAPSPTSARPVHWSYFAEGGGPSAWGSLHPDYAACARGHAQSPIDLDPETAGAASRTVSLAYGSSALHVAHTEQVEDIIDNGHTIQVSVDRGSTLTLAEGEFHLKQLHFHMPSEHRLKGASFPMEVHFVHQADDGRFAVLAAFVSPGAENAQFASILEHVPATKGEHAHPDGVVLELGTHLPPTTRVLEYAGSLTTPPCTEGVLWLVLSETRVTASQAQLDAFAARIAPNNRPIQERRGRPLSAASVSVRQAP